MPKLSSYDVQIAARVPAGFPELIASAAARTFITPSAYVRQALAEKLKRDGFEPQPAQAKGAAAHHKC